jgi:UDP-N-acetylmuramate dehydrogenase
VPLFSTKPLHSFHLSSGVKHLAEINSITDLNQVLELTNNGEFIVIGEGSNTIFIDDYMGTLILNKLVGIELTENDEFYKVSVGSGNNWNEFVLWCLSNNINGLENLALIPGTVGACPIQNIGAYGVEVKKFIDSVEYVDLSTGEVSVLDNKSCNFGYRDSVFKHELKDNVFITKVNFLFAKIWQPELAYAPLNSLESPTAKQIYDKVCEVRTLKLPDPKLIGNAGSFFKNPIVSNDKAEQLVDEYANIPNYEYNKNSKKIAAGWLIEQAGLKGFSLGNVAVHDMQALVLTNKTGDANGSELIELASHVMMKVYDKFGITLEPEVRFVGKHGEVKFSEIDQNVYG